MHALKKRFDLSPKCWHVKTSMASVSPRLSNSSALFLFCFLFSFCADSVSCSGADWKHLHNSVCLGRNYAALQSRSPASPGRFRWLDRFLIESPRAHFANATRPQRKHVVTGRQGRPGRFHAPSRARRCAFGVWLEPPHVIRRPPGVLPRHSGTTFPAPHKVSFIYSLPEIKFHEIISIQFWGQSNVPFPQLIRFHAWI